jgi:F-type H+-transporting ATPase subunit a
LESHNFRLLVERSSASAPVLFAFDLLEQFALNISTFLRLALFILVFLAPIAVFLFVANVLLETLLSFTRSVVNDIAQDDSIDFSRGILGFFTLFVCVLLSNLIGILPFGFTVTSSLAAPFLFSLAVMIIYFYTLIERFGLTLFAGFLPAGTNIFIAPLIVLIEIISTVAKFASLGIRLFANMFAGHLLLKVFYSISFIVFINASFIFMLSETVITLFLFFIVSLELMIALLQSFVILLLTVIYFKEAESFVNAH